MTPRSAPSPGTCTPSLPARSAARRRSGSPVSGRTRSRSVAGRPRARHVHRTRRAKSRCSTACSRRCVPVKATPSAWSASPAWASRGWCHEATTAMASRPEPVAILEGRCVSYGSLIPYLPLDRFAARPLQVAETDPPDVIRHAIDQAVRANGLPADAGTWLLRLIGIVDEATAHDSLSPEAVKARTFDALRLLFLKASARRPLVIVAEDVHWIDRTSEEFLATLVGQLVADPDPADRDLPAGLPRAMDGALVCHPDHHRPAQRRRERAAARVGRRRSALRRGRVERDPAARRGQSVLPRRARAHRRRTRRRRSGDSRDGAGRDHGPPRSPARRGQAAAANGIGGRTRSCRSGCWRACRRAAIWTRRWPTSAGRSSCTSAPAATSRSSSSSTR